MTRRFFATEALLPVLPTPKLSVQQSSDRTALSTPKTPSQRLLNLQQALGNRAVQRIILSRKPDAGATDTRSPVAVEDKPAVSPGDKGALAHAETIPTDWYIDSWGVASDIGGRAGRGDSRPDDVVMLEGLKIGSSRNSKIFDQAGNALKSGRSPLGSFDHSKGPGDVNGVVTYISQREIDIDFNPGTPPESSPLDQAAKTKKAASEKVLKAAAKKTVLDLIRDQHNDLSGNWDEIEKRAATAAAAQLPEGSKPEVKIKATAKHTGHRLETTPYRIDKPSTCTIKIIVPTSTTTYQVHGGEADTTTVAGGVAGSTTESQKLDIGSEIKTFVLSTKNSFIETVNSLHRQIISRGPGRDIQSDKGSDLSLGERAKKWLKEKGSELWEAAKNKVIDKATGLLKSRLAKWIIKGLELENFVEVTLAEWFVDWIGDKAADKIKGWLVKGHRGPEVKKPCNPKSTTPDPSLPDPRLPDPRLRDKCPDCHDRHPGPQLPSTPQSPSPGPTFHGPTLDPCPPETQPPLLRSDDHEIDTIFSQSTTEIVSTAEHANLEITKEESQSGFAAGQVVHHTEHYYSGR